MMEALWFVIGLIIGGTLGTIIMCCFQLHRVNRYEAELRRLREERDTKK